MKKAVFAFCFLIAIAASAQIGPVPGGGGGGSGTVTSFSAGDLSPLFTSSVATSTTTPALSFSLTNAGAGTLFGNATGAAAAPAFSATPVLGKAGTTLGTLTLSGNTSGSVLLTPQAAAGSPTLTFPNASGTFAISASSPLAISATTGNVTCATCATTTNGGALSGTSPITVSAAGAIACATCATSAASLTSGAIVTGAGSQGTQTPSATSTLDASGNASFAGTLAATGHTTFEGVTSTGATGTGKLVFDTSPTISGHPTVEGVTSTGATGTGKFMFDTAPTFTGASGQSMAPLQNEQTNDFTTSGVGTALETITGFSFVLPANIAKTYHYECRFFYIQNVANVGITFGESFSLSPTSSTNACEWTNGNAVASGPTTAIANTTTTQVCTQATPGDITNQRPGRIYGFIVNPSQAANTVQIYAKTTTAGDTVTVKAHSYCEVQ